MKLARRLGAAPSKLSFGDSAAQAGARRIRIGAAAGSRTQTCSVAGSHSAVKSQPRKLKGPGASLPPAHAISTKNKHLLAIYSIPARGFTAAVSVFTGTPPPKPLICKSVSNHIGARLRSRWADPTGGKPRLSGTIFSFATADIIETSSCYCSQFVHLSLSCSPAIPENKKPCSHEVSRVEKFAFDPLPAYLQIIQVHFGALPAIRSG